MISKGQKILLNYCSSILAIGLQHTHKIGGKKGSQCPFLIQYLEIFAILLTKFNQILQKKNLSMQIGDFCNACPSGPAPFEGALSFLCTSSFIGFFRKYLFEKVVGTISIVSK